MLDLPVMADWVRLSPLFAWATDGVTLLCWFVLHSGLALQLDLLDFVLNMIWFARVLLQYWFADLCLLQLVSVGLVCCCGKLAVSSSPPSR
ncbi:hypothetical protein D5086_005907 [Populus alba]|uniref:Uncharacterized protein n=1 Tax=Populus alba TaxID=43335 RepID=A0ACC4CW58_POPAL